MAAYPPYVNTISSFAYNLSFYVFMLTSIGYTMSIPIFKTDCINNNNLPHS